MRALAHLLLCTVLSPTSALALAATLQPAPPPLRLPSRLQQPRISRATVVASVDLPSADPRPPYLLSGLPRPRYRGALMGVLHRTRLFYLLAAGYFIAAVRLSAASLVPLTAAGIALRFIAAAFSSANVFISDAYHNGDADPKTYTESNELYWMKWDYVGISAVLCYNMLVWSMNLGWAGRSRLFSIYSVACFGLVSALATKLKGDRDSYGLGSTKLVKYLTGTQWLPALTCLVLCATPTSLAHGVIYLVYGAGLVLYLSKKPQSSVFGFHEYFHSFVVAGHLTSMGFDLADIAAPAARVAGPWAHVAAPINPSMVPWTLSPWLLLLALLPNKGRLFSKLKALGGPKADS